MKKKYGWPPVYTCVRCGNISFSKSVVKEFCRVCGGKWKLIRRAKGIRGRA